MARARERLAGQILFYQYVQWIATRQWQTIRQAAEGIEILGDFPFMVTLDSADVWSRREDFILDASVGTPPDAFSETGQEWGLPPYNWDEARRNDFAWLRMRARRQAQLYDGFRVDHLVGFYRTYVRPLDGRPPFFMPSEEPEQIALGETVMRIIIDTEADVSVEDLGTVPEFVRESIARLGLPGYKVWRWEPDDPDAVSAAVCGHDRNARHGHAGCVVGNADAGRTAALRLRLPAVRRHDPRWHHRAKSTTPARTWFCCRYRMRSGGAIASTCLRRSATRNWTYVLPWPSDTATAQPEAVDCANRLAGLTYQTGRWHPPMLTDP